MPQQCDTFMKYCMTAAPLAIIFQLFVGTPLHELGHFVMALLLGGKPVFAAWHRVTVQPGLPVYAYAIIAAAGPAASLGIGYAFLMKGKREWVAPAQAGPWTLRTKYKKFVAALVAVFGTTMMFTGVWNLVPFPKSDGHTIVRVFLAWVDGRW